MEATRLATGTRVAMVWPLTATLGAGVADLRAEPDDGAELVDQAHFGEGLRVLAERGGWRYVQGDDGYFGWIHQEALFVQGPPAGSRTVAVLLATVHAAADGASGVLGHAPAGTFLPELRQFGVGPDGAQREVTPTDTGPWLFVTWRRPDGTNRFRRGYIALADTAVVADLPQRPPTAEDLLATAGAFLGVPYLWGGTTALGLDCSGFVQQVYRLNGVGLPRDADQQAMFGRSVEKANAGDLLFFGQDSVTHVALATSDSEFIHAPETGRVVERGALGSDRRLRAIRRYLPEVVRDR